MRDCDTAESRREERRIQFSNQRETFMGDAGNQERLSAESKRGSSAKWSAAFQRRCHRATTASHRSSSTNKLRLVIVQRSIKNANSRLLVMMYGN